MDKPTHNKYSNLNIADRELEGIANFLVLYESVEQKMTLCEQKIHQQQMIYEQTINEQLQKIRVVMGEFQEIMTEVGAARWRISAENALKEGQTHIQLLQQTCEQVEKLLQESCGKLNLAASHVANEIKYAVDSLKKGDFKQLALEGYKKISDNTQHSIKHIYGFSCWVQMKAIITALIIALIVILTVGLYTSDEWPWESHERVVKERNIGQAILDAWPNLNDTERGMIQQITKRF